MTDSILERIAAEVLKPVLAELAALRALLEAHIMGAQDDINDAVTAMQDAASTLNADAQALPGLIGSGSGEVDTSALAAAVQPLADAVNAITQLATPASAPVTGDDTGAGAAVPPTPAG